MKHRKFFLCCESWGAYSLHLASKTDVIGCISVVEELNLYATVMRRRSMMVLCWQ